MSQNSRGITGAIGTKENRQALKIFASFLTPECPILVIFEPRFDLIFVREFQTVSFNEFDVHVNIISIINSIVFDCIQKNNFLPSFNLKTGREKDARHSVQYDTGQIASGLWGFGFQVFENERFALRDVNTDTFAGGPRLSGEVAHLPGVPRLGRGAVIGVVSALSAAYPIVLAAVNRRLMDSFALADLLRREPNWPIPQFRRFREGVLL